MFDHITTAFLRNGFDKEANFKNDVFIWHIKSCVFPHVVLQIALNWTRINWKTLFFWKKRLVVVQLFFRGSVFLLKKLQARAFLSISMVSGVFWTFTSASSSSIQFFRTLTTKKFKCCRFLISIAVTVLTDWFFAHRSWESSFSNFFWSISDFCTWRKSPKKP